MIKLPLEYKQNIINRYNKEGINWLNNIDKLIEKYKNKFKLINIKLIKNLSMNIVLSANSPEYGEIILKIGSPSKTSTNEINYMKLCSQKYFAKCYYYNLEDKVMLLEKLTPGYPLTELKNQNERIEIFCNILNNITNNNIPQNQFSNYNKELKERIQLVKNNQNQFKDILYMVDTVNSLYNKLEEMNLPKYVLHEDLNPRNILKSGNTWKIIDPHGAVAEKVFETSMFIKSEITNTSLDETDNIATIIAKNIHEDKELIYQALYIYLFSKITYHIKVKSNTDTIRKEIQISNKILEYIL